VNAILAIESDPSAAAEGCAPWTACRSPAETLVLLDTLQSKAPVGFIFVDRDFRFVRVNEMAAAINGVATELCIGRTVAEVVPDLWLQIEPIYRRVLASNTSVVNVELSGETKAEDRRRSSWLTSFYPVEVEGVVIGIGVAIVDITERKEAELAQSTLTRAAVEAIASTVEARDPYTAGHQRRVSLFSAAIAEELAVSAFDTEGIVLAADIHDVGKISVPAEILSKPTRLKKVEFELIKEHSRDGYEIMKGIAFPWPVAEMILQHHERLDGSGYPGGLAGDEILLGARIIAVADVVEAMSSHRPYRAALGIEAALREIADGSGRLYDPVVVDACLRLFRDGRLGAKAA
jgi:PAS domain S-box-containing protein